MIFAILVDFVFGETGAVLGEACAFNTDTLYAAGAQAFFLFPIINAVLYGGTAAI